MSEENVGLMSSQCPWQMTAVSSEAGRGFQTLSRPFLSVWGQFWEVWFSQSSLVLSNPLNNWFQSTRVSLDLHSSSLKSNPRLQFLGSSLPEDNPARGPFKLHPITQNQNWVGPRLDSQATSLGEAKFQDTAVWTELPNKTQAVRG